MRVAKRLRTHARSTFGWALGCWRGLTTAILDPYRPELHYMRGPGPKWHEKFAGE
jgi:hypothetical protein